LRRCNAWVWEISEIGATTRRADVESLKAFVTGTTSKERKAYGTWTR
jgi:predicted P-loop ATPase